MWAIKIDFKFIEIDKKQVAIKNTTKIDSSKFIE